MRFVIVTGLSGAGRSQAIRCLEDLGYFCIDNLPPVLIPKFAEICYSSQGKINKAALVIDIRGGELFKKFFDGLNSLSSSEFSYEILFLEASDETIIKRYKESRRKHPLSPEGKIIDGIQKEREMLAEIREKANHIIDTSNLLPQQLKEEIVNIFVEGKKYEGIIIDVMSFGFKYGIPVDADLVFDVRFLPNPYYIAELKSLSGLDNGVQDYVLQWEQTQVYLEKLQDMIEYLIPYYVEEGKSQLVIAIGCTGGMHRSVTMAEVMYQRLKEKDHRVIKHHRDIEKDGRR